MLALEQELEVVAQLNEHNSKLKAIYFVMKHCNIDSKVEAHRIVTDILVLMILAGKFNSID